MNKSMLKTCFSIITAITVMSSYAMTVNAGTLLDYFKTDEHIEAINDDIRNRAEFAGFDENYGDKVYGATNVTIDEQSEIKFDCITDEELYLIVIEAVAEDLARIEISCGTYGRITYDVAGQKSKYYIPAIGNNGNFFIKGNNGVANAFSVEVYKFSTDFYNINDLKCGVWLCDEYETIEIALSEKLLNYGATVACASDENYIYVALQNGKFLVCKQNTDETLTILKEFEGIYDVRKMSFANDGRTLVVPARANGVYLFDVTNGENVNVISHIDTLEMASNALAEGNYLYICSRYFGVEIYDISTPQNPIFCSLARDGRENQFCTVNNGVLYVGVYNECIIKAYDVTNPYNPILLYNVTAPGKVYGIDNEGGYLYTTITLYNGKNKMENGVMNGFAVYKLMSDSAPELITVVRLDGRSSSEYSDIYLIDARGDKLYLSHTYNGLYIYDITNPVMPERILNVRVPVYSYDSMFRTNTSSTAMYPFNRKYMMPDPIVDFSISDGEVYLAGLRTGFYKFDYEDAYYENRKLTTTYAPDSSKLSVDKINLDGYKTDVYKTDGMVYAALKHNGKYYVASGSDGLHVLDQNLCLINKIPFEGFVKDIKIGGNRLYIATSDGVYVYSFENLYNYLAYFPYRQTSSIQITSNGEYLMVQGTKIAFCKVSEIDSALKIEKIHEETVLGLYYRNLITNLVDDRYFGVATGYATLWFDTESEQFEKLPLQFKTNILEVCGQTAYKDKAIAVYSGGIVIYDPKDTTVDLKQSKIHKFSGHNIAGKCTVVEDKLFVIREATGEVWIIDISNIEKPTLEVKITTKGSPDIITGSNSEILMPNKHEGLVRFTRID